ncbi:MAG: hypothetical protein WBG17_14530 [Burkholderiaceae bacterium]
MPDRKAAEDFAAELTRRFEEMTQWAIAHWPYPNFPLMESDFAESRRELSAILGARLDAGNQGPPPGPGDSGQYVDVTPMPWP